MANDGRLIAHLHQPAMLLDLVDDEWRADHLGHGARFFFWLSTHRMRRANKTPHLTPLLLSHADDFDLPTTDFDEDGDESRAVPKQNDEEKWTELCLDEFLQPNRRPHARGMH